MLSDTSLRLRLGARSRRKVASAHLEPTPGSPHGGSFARWKARRPPVDAAPEGPHTALVRDTREKDSDVSLATHLLHDAIETSHETGDRQQ